MRPSTLLSLSFVIFNLLLCYRLVLLLCRQRLSGTMAEADGGGSESGFGGSIDQVLTIAKECRTESKKIRDLKIKERCSLIQPAHKIPFLVRLRDFFYYIALGCYVG